LRVMRRIDRTHGFLVACRTASAIAWYARGKAILREQRLQAVVVSSDTNPEEVGFTAAARALGIATIFISHAYPTPFSPPLAFDLSILGGQAEVDARRRKGTIGGEILLAGLEGESTSLDPTQFGRREPIVQRRRRLGASMRGTVERGRVPVYRSARLVDGQVARDCVKPGGELGGAAEEAPARAVAIPRRHHIAPRVLNSG